MSKLSDAYEEIKYIPDARWGMTLTLETLGIKDKDEKLEEFMKRESNKIRVELQARCKHCEGVGFNVLEHTKKKTVTETCEFCGGIGITKL